jgi:hypothetical protein
MNAIRPYNELMRTVFDMVLLAIVLKFYIVEIRLDLKIKQMCKRRDSRTPLKFPRTLLYSLRTSKYGSPAFSTLKKADFCYSQLKVDM